MEVLAAPQDFFSSPLFEGFLPNPISWARPTQLPAPFSTPFLPENLMPVSSLPKVLAASQT